MMTRRKLLKIGAGAAAIAVGGAGLADAAAKAATPARLEGIWPYCVWWYAHVQESGLQWWVGAWFRAIPLKTFKNFDANRDDEQALALPFPGTKFRVLQLTGWCCDWHYLNGGVMVMFKGGDWPLSPWKVLDVNLAASKERWQ